MNIVLKKGVVPTLFMILLVGCQSDASTVKKIDPLKPITANPQVALPTVNKCPGLIVSPDKLADGYVTSHGAMLNYDYKKLQGITRNMTSLGFDGMIVSSVFRGSQVNPGNSIFPQDKIFKGRDIFAEIKTVNPKMSVTAFLESGTLIQALKTNEQSIKELRALNYDGTDKVDADGVKLYQLDLFNPKVVLALVELSNSYAKNKNVNGLKFDDHFIIMPESGYSDYSIRRFLDESGVKTQSMDEKTIWSKRPKPNDKKWLEFKTKRVSFVFQQMIKSARGINPNIEVGLTTNPDSFMIPRSHNPVVLSFAGVPNYVGYQLYNRDTVNFRSNYSVFEKQYAARQMPCQTSTIVAILLGLSKDKYNPLVIEQSLVEIKKLRKVEFFGINTLNEGDDPKVLQSNQNSFRTSLVKWKQSK